MHYDLVVMGNTSTAREAALTAVSMNRWTLVVRPGQAARQTSARARPNRCGLRRIEECGQPARFLGPHTIEVATPCGGHEVTAERFLIATGTRSARSPLLPCNGRDVVDSEQIRSLERVPRSMIVIGGGRLGMQTAIEWASRGTKVTVVDGRRHLDHPADSEAAAGTFRKAQQAEITFHLGQEAIGIERPRSDHLAVVLASGTLLPAEMAVVCLGRVGKTEGLNLPATGLQPDERGRLWCNQHGQTWVDHIYAAGSVIGFPEQRGSPRSQAIRAVSHALGATNTGSIPPLRFRDSRNGGDERQLGVPTGVIA